jgi:hypothetical protein
VIRLARHAKRRIDIRFPAVLQCLERFWECFKVHGVRAVELKLGDNPKRTGKLHGNMLSARKPGFHDVATEECGEVVERAERQAESEAVWQAAVFGGGSVGLEDYVGPEDAGDCTKGAEE